MKKFAVLVALIIVFLLPVGLGVLAQEDASPEAESVREKVKEKVEKALNQPKAYIGTVTDITGQSVQIGNSEDEILQLSVSVENTTFIQLGKTSKVVNFEDLGIGDYTIAMGYKNENDVLEASRLLMGSEPETSDRLILMAKTLTVSNNSAEVKELVTEEEYVIEPDSGIRVTFSDDGEVKKSAFRFLEEGDKIILVGEFDDDGILLVRRLHMLPSEDVSPTPAPEEIEE